MIVDTHVHVISDDQRKYPRKTGKLPEWVQDMTGEMLIALNREAGIDKTVLVQGFGPYAEDNNYAADCGVQHANHFTCVCIVDQLQKDAPDKLTYWMKERGVRGLRFVTTGEEEVMIDDPRGLPLWERAVSLAIPVCIMGRFHQVARMPAVLERFTSIPVALDHIAVPRLSDGPPYDSSKPLFDLVRFPNLYLKFSSETIYAARKGKSTCKEFFSLLLDRFGAKRIMWGSNYPATHDRSLKEQLEMAREELSFLPSEDQRWLFGETALTLWPMLR
jgi:predicted TIM-barrel fold metal-dependent hydrolase